MAVDNKNPNIEEEEESSIQDFLSDYDLRVKQAAKLAPPPPEKDEDLVWVRQPAPNAIQWTVGKSYLNNPTTYKHVRQYQIVRDFFELRCPLCNSMAPADIDCWGKTQMALEDEILLEWSESERTDICPKCRTTRAELIEDGLVKNYNQMHGVVGMRGGKTVTASIICSYIEHRIYTYHYTTDGGIARLFDQMPHQPFEMTFIASSDVQSKDTVWAHFIGRRQQSPWLQRYIRWLKVIEKNTPKIAGLKAMEYIEKEKEIDNAHLNLTFNSMNSNSSGMAGRTRIAAAVDELSRFQNSDSRLSADEAYRVLENSLKTLRSMSDRLKLPSFFGAMISITSPIAAEDKAMRMLKQAPDLKRMYAFHYPTWMFNPYQPRSAFDDDYIKDPLGAERDFGANPPAAANPLIDDPERYKKAAVDVNLVPSAVIRYYDRQDQVGNTYKAAKLDQADLKTDADRYIVFDAGLTFDTFAGAAAHGEWWDVPGVDQPVWVTVYDWVLRIVPEGHPVRKDVWFDSVMDIVYPLKQKHRIARIEFDRWNSATLIQSIRDIGLEAEQKGTTVQDFIKYVADAYTGRVRMLSPGGDVTRVSPELLDGPAAAIYELERLERSPDLRRVFNPNKGQRRGWNSDDVAQCIVHVHRLVQDQVAATATGRGHSAESRLKAEQTSGSAWGRQGAGKVFHPRGGTGGRNW